MFDDPEAYLGLPTAFVDEVKEGWAKYQPRQPRADAEAIVKRKIAQRQEAASPHQRAARPEARDRARAPLQVRARD
jgi:hypothetical protein